MVDGLSRDIGALTEAMAGYRDDAVVLRAGRLKLSDLLSETVIGTGGDVPATRLAGVIIVERIGVGGQDLRDVVPESRCKLGGGMGQRWAD
jgi:hypothetical protein